MVDGVRVSGEPVALEHLTEAHAEAVVRAAAGVGARLPDHEPDARRQREVVGRPVRRAHVRRALRHQELVVHQARERDARLRRVLRDLVRALHTSHLTHTSKAYELYGYYEAPKCKQMFNANFEFKLVIGMLIV